MKSWRRVESGVLLVLALVLASCRGCGCGSSDRPSASTHLEMFVPGVPLTLDEAKALDGKDGRKVEVKKGEAVTHGGGACGHSPLCLVFVPIMLAEAAFPEHHRMATIEKDGKVVMVATYTDGGSFLGATLYEGTTARHVIPLRAECIDRTLGIEMSRSEVGPDGQEGPETRSSIEAQVPLQAAYRAHIDKLAASDGSRAADCAIEAVRLLDAEALPMVRDLMKVDQPEVIRQKIVTTTCHEKLFSAESSTREVASLALEKPSVSLALDVLPCFVTDEHLDAAAAGPALDAVVSGLAQLKEPEASSAIAELAQGPGCTRADALDSCRKEYAEALRDRVPKIEDPNARVTLALALDLPFSKDDAVKLLFDEKLAALGSMAAGNLRADHPAHREVARALLGRPSGRSGEAIELLAEGSEPLSEPELAQLLARLREPQPPRVRAIALEWLKDRVVADAELAAFREAEKKATDDEERLGLASVLVRRGDKEAGGRAITLVVPLSCIPARLTPTHRDGGIASTASPSPSAAPTLDCEVVGWGSVSDPTGVYSAETLARFELHQAGCSDDDLQAAAVIVARGGTVSSLACVGKH